MKTEIIVIVIIVRSILGPAHKVKTRLLQRTSCNGIDFRNIKKNSVVMSQGKATLHAGF
jgi:hypothetical protein